MIHFLPFFIAVPLAGFLISLLIPNKKESILSFISMGVVGTQLAGILAFILWWVSEGAEPLDYKHFVLYKSPGFEFFFDYYFDRTTAVFALMGAVLTFLVTIFSRYYLHREAGFKRFFNTLILFVAGYNLVVFSGNFETLFVGWELLGITSFLLISFYRDRYLPVKNGFKVLSFYRLGDICLILAMWMSHHLWHRNITFAEWNLANGVQEVFYHHYGPAMFIAAMILLAAAIKSAQIPFSTWLPRAMEGPTSSSAIFYGSLSVHIGVFLLLRTAPFWEHSAVITGIIFTIGLITSILSTSIARVQSSVKTQIAYASIAQIGLIFIELSLGFHLLALIHFAGNAFLRTYQLLVSPSVLGYLVHDMFFHFTPKKSKPLNPVMTRLQQAVYVWSIKEWNLDFLLHRYLWQPFKWIGCQLGFLTRSWGQVSWVLILAVGIATESFKADAGIPVDRYHYASAICSAISLMMVLKAFSARTDARHSWLLVVFSQLFIALSIIWNKDIALEQIGLYLSGTVLAGLAGYICLQKMKSMEGDLSLDQYHGHSYEYPALAGIFLLSGLGLAGFPITPTFIGIDLLFTHVSSHQVILMTLMALNFLFLELTIIRIYARVFLGQHKKAYHPIAFKSS